MYSKRHPITRTQIFAAYAKALEALTGEVVAEPVQTEQHDVDGIEYLGYWAAKLMFELRAREAYWTCWITPILASMGVSGEHHAWTLHHAPSGVSLHGTACSAARSPSFAELVIERSDDAVAERVCNAFIESFPRVLTDEELESES